MKNKFYHLYDILFNAGQNKFDETLIPENAETLVYGAFTQLPLPAELESVRYIIFNKYNNHAGDNKIAKDSNLTIAKFTRIRTNIFHYMLHNKNFRTYIMGDIGAFMSPITDIYDIRNKLSDECFNVLKRYSLRNITDIKNYLADETPYKRTSLIEYTDEILSALEINL